jgi:hypothetical protein
MAGKTKHARSWKRLHPASLRQSMEYCLLHAREKRNLSVERVAELMGVPGHWALSKWMENGRIPGVLIPSFEFACGIDFVTRYLAHIGGKLVLTVPPGRPVEAKDVQSLQVLLADLIGKLLAYREGKETAETVCGVLIEGMEALAYQHGQIQKAVQPELDFGSPYDDQAKSNVRARVNLEDQRPRSL